MKKPVHPPTIMAIGAIVHSRTARAVRHRRLGEPSLSILWANLGSPRSWDTSPSKTDFSAGSSTEDTSTTVEPMVSATPTHAAETWFKTDFFRARCDGNKNTRCCDHGARGRRSRRAVGECHRLPTHRAVSAVH